MDRLPLDLRRKILGMVNASQRKQYYLLQRSRLSEKAHVICRPEHNGRTIWSCTLPGGNIMKLYKSNGIWSDVYVYTPKYRRKSHWFCLSRHPQALYEGWVVWGYYTGATVGQWFLRMKSGLLEQAFQLGVRPVLGTLNRAVPGMPRIVRFPKRPDSQVVKVAQGVAEQASFGFDPTVVTPPNEVSLRLVERHDLLDGRCHLATFMYACL